MKKWMPAIIKKVKNENNQLFKNVKFQVFAKI